MTTLNGQFDINELAINLQQAASIKSNNLDFVNDPPGYEYPDEDMLIPVNSEMDAMEYAYKLEFPEFENLAPRTRDKVPEIAPGTANYSNANLQLEINFPEIKKVGRLKGFDMIAELFKCAECPSSYLEFWFIDIVEECLMYAQDCPEITHDNLGLIVSFLISFLKDVRIQQLDLCGMLTHFKLKLNAFDGKLTINNTDESSEENYKYPEFSEEILSEEENASYRGLETEENFTNITEIFFILEYIYKAFGNSFIYKTLQVAMLDPPVYVEQDLPYRVEFPKQYLPSNLENPISPLKKKPAKKGKGKEKKAKSKSKEKKKAKGKEEGKESKIVPSLATQNPAEDLEQQALEANRQLEMKKYILPLKLSVGPEFYAELFKPLPKPEKKGKEGSKKKGKKMR